jgi:hypothetical protein
LQFKCYHVQNQKSNQMKVLWAEHPPVLFSRRRGGAGATLKFTSHSNRDRQLLQLL